MKKLFTVTGMTCESCKEVIEDIARDYAEIQSCMVDLKTGQGELVCEDTFDVEKFRAEINSLGKYSLQFLS